MNGKRSWPTGGARDRSGRTTKPAPGRRMASSCSRVGDVTTAITRIGVKPHLRHDKVSTPNVRLAKSCQSSLSGRAPSRYSDPVRLREAGVNVLGVGDASWEELRPELQAALCDYVHVPDMNHYDAMLRALGLFTHRHGKLDGIDSNNEHWLPVEAPSLPT